MLNQIKMNEYFRLKDTIEFKLKNSKVSGFVLMDSICICERYFRDLEFEDLHQDILKFIIKLYHYNGNSSDVVRIGFIYVRKFGYDLRVLEYMLHAYIITKNYDKAQKFLENCSRNCEFLEWIEESLKIIKEKIELDSKNNVVSKEIASYNEKRAFREENRKKAQAEKYVMASKRELAKKQVRLVSDKVEEPDSIIGINNILPKIEPSEEISSTSFENCSKEKQDLPEKTSEDDKTKLLPERPARASVEDPIFYRQNVARIFKNFYSASSEPKKVLSRQTPYRSYLVKQNELMIRLESEKQETVIEDVNKLLSLDSSLENRLLQIEILFICEEYDKALNRLSRIKLNNTMSSEDLNSLKRMVEMIRSVFYDSNANIDENHEALQEEIRNILIRKEQK